MVGWMRALRTSGRTRGAAAAVGTTALIMGGLVVAAPSAQAATIPTPPAVCKPTPATTTPVLDSFAFSPAAVNVTAAAKTVTVTVTAHDTVPITSIYVAFQKNGTNGRTQGALSRVAGTTTNGTWRGNLVVPRWLASGVWKVVQVTLNDSKSGYSYYSPNGGFATPYPTLTTWGAWPTDLTVTSVPDVTPPSVTKLTLGTKAVNTTKLAASVSVAVVMTDSQSGIAGGGLYASISGAPKTTSSGAFLVKSAKLKNTYVGTMRIPTWVGKGARTWKLQLQAYDRVGNVRSFTTPQLAAKKWQSTLKVTSLTDTTNPTLVSLSFAPTSVDATAAAKKVPFTLKVKDTMSGVASGTVIFTAPSGFATAYGTVTKVTGTPLNRTLTGYVLVPRCGDPGTWKASVSISDVWGHTVNLSSAALAARRQPVNLLVKDIDTIAPDYKAPTSVAAGSSVTLTFSEPVLFAASIGATIDTKVDFTAATGTWVCKNRSSAVVTCDADGANVVTATWTPTTPLTSGQSVSVSAKANYPTPTGIYDTTGNALSYLYDYISVT